MNLASWVILIIVIAIVALAIKATFFKGEGKGGCCDTGDKRKTGSCCDHDKQSQLDREIAAQISACSKTECGSCTLCDENSAVRRNAVMPVVREG